MGDRSFLLWLPRLIGVVLMLWPLSGAATGIISATAFSVCGPDLMPVQIKAFSFLFRKADKHFEFRVSGQSDLTTNITLRININAYGINAYTKELDPCGAEYFMKSLCPLQRGSFAATGNVVVPEKMLKELPSLVFAIPDLQGFVMLDFITNSSIPMTCIRAPVSNGQSLASSTARAVTGSVAASALVVSGAASIAASLSTTGAAIGATSAGGTPSVMSTSPNFGEVLFWFQTVGFNGVFSVAYPNICNSFYHNFGWAVGLMQWHSMQSAIDTFRNRTGGDLTSSSIDVLNSSTLVYPSHVALARPTARNIKRNSDIPATHDDQGHTKTERIVTGIRAFAEELKIPSQNTFMTILVLFLLLLAILLASSILAKFAMDLMSRWCRLPTWLDNFRQNYWSSIAKLLLRSMLIVYGTWCIFCLFQFRYGDSWAASLLAGLSFACFSSIIVFLAVRIIHIAIHDESHGEKGRDRLYGYKPYLQKYGILYDQFQKGTWWFFIPLLVYSVVKACFIALADGHGFVQVIGCMVCEIVLLAFLLWTQAYETPQANIVNISISVVRILSLIGTLLFVDILGLRETTKTVAGIIMIVLQSSMTLVLAILVIFNGVMPLFTKKKALENPEEEQLMSDPMSDLGPRQSLSEQAVEKSSMNPPTAELPARQEDDLCSRSDHALTQMTGPTAIPDHFGSSMQDLTEPLLASKHVVSDYH